MENSTTFQVVIAVIGIVISGSYPLFSLFLKNQEKKFTKLFSKTDKITGIEKDIDYMKEEINRLRDKENGKDK